MTRRLDLNALLLFYETVNARSINKAALKLGMPKSTISRKLTALEQELGSTLLKRGQRALGLTEIGHALYLRCESIAQELENADLHTTKMQEEMSGVLRISMPVFFVSWISHPLADFAKEFPGLRLEIEAQNRVVDVAEEPFDVAIHFGLPAETHNPMRRLAELPRSFYASPGYLAQRGPLATLDDLVNHDVILHQYQQRDRVFPDMHLPDGTTVALTPRVVVNHAVLVQELALQDLGIGLMPDIMCKQDVAAGRLIRLPLDWTSPPLLISATYLERRYAPRKMRALLDRITEHLKTQA